MIGNCYITDLVPHFTQNPVSYIKYPLLNDAYLDLDVLLSIRPETTDGIVFILYCIVYIENVI